MNSRYTAKAGVSTDPYWIGGLGNVFVTTRCRRTWNLEQWLLGSNYLSRRHLFSVNAQRLRWRPVAQNTHYQKVVNNSWTALSYSIVWKSWFQWRSGNNSQQQQNTKHLNHISKLVKSKIVINKTATNTTLAIVLSIFFFFSSDFNVLCVH